MIQYQISAKKSAIFCTLLCAKSFFILLHIYLHLFGVRLGTLICQSQPQNLNLVMGAKFYLPVQGQIQRGLLWAQSGST